MAKYSGSAFGTISGKIGDAVAATWRGIKTVRAYQPNVNDQNSTAQQTQRGKLGDAVHWLKATLAFFIKPLMDSVAGTSTGWANAVKNAIAVAQGSGVFTYADMVFSSGSRLQPAIATGVTDISNGTSVITWSTTVSTGLNASSDLIRVVLYNSTRDKWGIPTATALLSAGTITITNPTGTILADHVHAYLCSTDTNGENPSGTSYLNCTVQA